MTDKIRRLLKKGKTASEIAAQLKIEPNRVHTVKWLDGKKKYKGLTNTQATLAKKLGLKNAADFKKVERPSKIIKTARITKTELDALLPKPDPVNHPPHYKSGGIETIDFIEAKDLNYRLGNVVKYVSRAGRKAGSDPVVDLEKAAFYLKREIDARKSA